MSFVELQREMKLEVFAIDTFQSSECLAMPFLFYVCTRLHLFRTSVGTVMKVLGAHGG